MDEPKHLLQPEEPGLQAEQLINSGNVERALELYGEAAEKEKLLFNACSNDKVRTKTILAGSCASLYYKARQYEKAIEWATRFEATVHNNDESWRLQEAVEASKVALDLFSYQRQMVQAAKTLYTRELKKGVALLIERFNASSAWLFSANNRDLVPCIVQNGANEIRNIGIDEKQSIVAHVARERKPYCCTDTVNDSLYLELVSTTRSEIAAPVIGYDGVLLGVLNLESNQVGAFSATREVELKSAVADLCVGLRLLKSVEPDHPHCGWYFHQHGWGMAYLLRDLCFYFSERVGKANTLCTATVWQWDHAKDYLFVRATGGFDSEYATEKTLPLDSFTGHVCRLPRGCVERGDWGEFEDVFVRKDIARRMDLRYVVATPIYLPGESTAFGALNIYCYRERNILPNTLVSHMADVIGGMIGSHERLQPAIAAEYCAERIAPSRSSLPKCLELIKSTLAETLRSEGCSIFALEKESLRLRCIATTGLETGRGKVVNDYSGAWYDVKRDCGLTVSLLDKPFKVIRKNDVPDPNEKGQGLPAQPLNKFRERFAMSAVDHRRFLGISVAEQNETLGAIRLNRSSTSKPFIPSDERMLESIARVCASVLGDLRTQKTQPSQPGLPKTGRDARRRHPDVIESFTRLINPASDWDVRAPKQSFSQILQDTLAVFSQHKAIMASLRQVTVVGDEEEQLTVRAFHSTRSSEPLNELEHPLETRNRRLTDTEQSNAWLAIDSGKVLTFNKVKSGNLFKPIHRDSERVATGVCVPFTTIICHEPVRWVFCLDFEKVVKWRDVDFFPLFHSAHKLSTVASAISTSFIDVARYLPDVLRRCSNASNAAWVLVETRERQGGFRRARKLGKPPSNLNVAWQSSRQAGVDIGLEVDGKNRMACRMQLSSCGAVSGRLTWGSAKGTYTDEFIKNSVNLSEIFQLGAPFPYLLSANTFFFEPKMTRSSAVPNSPGVQLWDGALVPHESNAGRQ